MKEVSFDLGHISISGFSNEKVDKPLVLALHGWLDNAGSFELMMPYLDNFHVIALDFPGHGHSNDRSADAQYHFVEWVYDIAKLIKVRNWQRLSIVGHSMGGMVAQVLAATLPEVISRVVMLDAIGFITTPPENTCQQLRHAIDSRIKMSSRVKAVHADLESAIKVRVSAGDVNHNHARILAKRGVMKAPNGYVWRSDQRLRAHSAIRYTLEQAQSFIESIECPVLMIRASNTSNVLQQNYEIYHRWFIELRTLDVEGGHHFHMEQPELTARLVTDFLAMA